MEINLIKYIIAILVLYKIFKLIPKEKLPINDIYLFIGLGLLILFLFDKIVVPLYSNENFDSNESEYSNESNQSENFNEYSNESNQSENFNESDKSIEYFLKSSKKPTKKTKSSKKPTKKTKSTKKPTKKPTKKSTKKPTKKSTKKPTKSSKTKSSKSSKSSQSPKSPKSSQSSQSTKLTKPTQSSELELLKLLQTKINNLEKTIKTDINKNIIEDALMELIKKNKYVDSKGVIQDLLYGDLKFNNQLTPEQMQALGSYDNTFNNKWDNTYTLLNTDKWRPPTGKQPVCKQEKVCPVCPTLTSGYPLSVMDFDKSRSVMGPDGISVNYVKELNNPIKQ
jgi:hypothetical protein